MPPKQAKKYTKKDPIQHVIDRPDMYVGSKRLRKTEEYIVQKDEEDNFFIEKKEIESSPAILRIFVEALSNAIDNVDRSKKAKISCTTIKVNINKETGETSVWNDGDVVPIEINEDENIYNHTLIFGNLLTGSNYNDEEERLISGRNGLGIKLTNIFSTKFKVKGLDPSNKKVLVQEWKNNMKTVGDPKITDTKLVKGYTEVSWIPDFKLFELEGYTDDIIKLYTKFVIDAAMITKIKVYLNDELIPVNNLQSYSKLYKSPTTENILIKHTDSEVLITTSDQFQAISFVNGVYTKLGGQHVDAWSEVLFRPIVDKFNKKGQPKININDVKQFFRIFVVSTIPNPEFDGQDKHKLESPKVTASIKTSDINKILKWSIMEDIEDVIKLKEFSVLKKSEKKKKGYTKIEGYDRANNSGGKLSHECSLILCEGLSAKTYAVSGIKKGVFGKAGRDWWGILPLRGKTLNVRNSNATTIAKNAVITDLIQAIGLQHGLDYKDDKNYKTLSYGKIILLTDADVDGLHIEGLIMNFFHTLFPTLLERPEPFLLSMKTPIVRVFNPKGDILFYDENRFKDFISKQTKPIKSKYYKGLGTTKKEDVPDTFGKKMVEYKNDEKANESMNKVFHKKFSDERKTWLEKYNPASSISLDDGGELVPMDITEFLNNEVIKFSHNDCKRSIPCLIDGLKESQRKILYAVKKKNLTYNKPSLKVAQLGGYVAEHTNYHHGEQNLYETIIKMAQDFPGSNNIPLFYRDGMFGTKLSGGKDAASPRYIFTKMETLTPLLFREEDDVLLERVVDDGDIVEPKFYVPILPMILINGCTAGIGTGWSSSVPCYNPKDIIECIKIWLDNDGEIKIHDPEDNTIVSLLPEIKPWYRQFTGKIESVNENKYISYGNIIEEKNKIIVNELPINMWTDKFRDMAEDWLVEKQIKSMKNYSTDEKVNFVIVESEDGMKCSIDNMKLYSYIFTSNMVLFNENEQLKKYSIEDIIDDFCTIRFQFYIKRKKHIIQTLEKDLKHLSNKARFIQEIIDNKLNIMNVEEDIIIKELTKRGYDKEHKNKEKDDDDEDTNGFDYLLKLQVRTFTASKVKQLKQDIENIKTKIKTIKDTSEKTMWLNDIQDFLKEYEKWLVIMERSSTFENKPKITKKKT
jgi:DNA topoisomerase-2